MILTTSRKPSRRTRSFAKALARFANWRYVNRGKMGLKDIVEISKDFVIVSETKANPSFLWFYRNGEAVLRIRFTVSNVKKVEMDDSPAVFIGKAPFDPTLINAIPQIPASKKLIRKVDFPKKIFVKGEKLEFYYKNILVFTMKLLDVEKLKNSDAIYTK